MHQEDTMIDRGNPAGRWRYLRWLLGAPLLALVLWACGAHPLALPDPMPEAEVDRAYEVNPLRQLDLLFVVDNSGSMTEEQANLQKNFPDFMKALQNIQGGLPDTRIAVISTNFGAGPTALGRECPVLGDKGAFQAKAGCGLDTTKSGYFLTMDSKGAQNFTGTLPEVFSCMAKLGNEGCGFEHQLQSMRAALAASETPSSLAPGNRGFLRKDAFLGIVILSDEDDCSGEGDALIYKDRAAGQSGSLRCALLGHVCNDQAIPASKTFTSTLAACKPYQRQDSEKATRLINVQEFVKFVKDLKGGSDEKIIVSSIIGWSDDPQAPYSLRERTLDSGETELELSPVCSQSMTGSAAPGIRLHSFTRSFKHNTVHRICEADLKSAMTQIGDKMAALIDPTCLKNVTLVDTDLAKAGVQPDCQVTDRLRNASGGYTDQPLPGCAPGGPSPCWEVAHDPVCDGYRTFVRRPNDELPPPDTVQLVKCLACTESTDPARCQGP
jgi:hypothetical protein